MGHDHRALCHDAAHCLAKEKGLRRHWDNNKRSKNGPCILSNTTQRLDQTCPARMKLGRGEKKKSRGRGVKKGVGGCEGVAEREKKKRADDARTTQKGG